MRSRIEHGALATVLAAAIAGCGERPPSAAPVGRQEPPRAVSTPPPDYPEALACEGIGGQVDLRIAIQPDGTVGDVKLQRSSGRPELDAAATVAVRKWLFKPATRGGQPFAMTIAVPMTFRAPAERPDRCFVLDEQQGGS